MHYVNAPDIGLCQCGLYQFHGTTFLANFQSKPRENRRKSAISTARATPKLSKFSLGGYQPTGGKGIPPNPPNQGSSGKK
jgi:hypothetical protein